jgi:hypothetical protein
MPCPHVLHKKLSTHYAALVLGSKFSRIVLEANMDDAKEKWVM